MMNCQEGLSKNSVVGLGLGQFLSLLITSTGLLSSELAKKGINAPTSQSFLNYILLALVYGGIMLYRRKALKQAKWYYYVLLGLVDVEANFLVVKAYQYTSITSVMLLDCWSIPCVLLFTWFFLKTKYRFKKLVGVVICIAGLVIVIFSDVHSADRASGSNPIKGDLLVIAGATLYAVSNVGEEFFVKSADRVELMSFLGIFGAIVSAVQISILERSELKSIHWSAGAALPFVGFSVAMFLFYSGVPILLKISGSTMLNLSLLTSDMWAVLIRIFAYHEKVDWMYFVAFAVVTAGLIVYSVGDKMEENPAEVGDEEVEQSKHFDEEAGMSNPDHNFASSSAVEKDELASNDDLKKEREGKKF
ncbi:solute carrier family 35 member F1-like isoform X1 [Olea europaea var. sylvestris]|uniref:solute carrier family 35 member F1-like isoform X1 n=2 Tax=Olea europaea var. sylvestris TaxID=158386 RepID=UPI000C1CF171|nr:solute carrier family 35 member F1-like isoform X1 [Olea europaea var. sylvestris]